LEYQKVENNFIIKLTNGDDIFQSIYQVVNAESIDSAWINGLGACENVVIGSFPISEKKYLKKKLNGDYEIISLVGNLSYKDNLPFLHLHITLSDHDCNVFGGHLFSATVTATCEIILFGMNKKINRKIDEFTGLHLLDLNCG
tara:strand:- start:260 stop:688 length:429 start_codon:yes stop_codon:yes gene_type:complete